MGRQWIRPGPRPLRRPRSADLPSPTRSPIRSDSPTEAESSPEPSDSPTEAEPSDTPAETESPPEPSDSPVASETPLPTLTSAPTEAEASEAALPSTEATSPGTTDEPAEGDADEDSEGVPAWVWWLLAALALALAVGIPLLVRSRRSKAWSSDLAGSGARGGVVGPRAVAQSAAHRLSRAGGGRMGRRRPIAYSLSTTGSRASRQLPPTTPAGSARARCATPYVWLAAAWTAWRRQRPTRARQQKLAALPTTSRPRCGHPSPSRHDPEGQPGFPISAAAS